MKKKNKTTSKDIEDWSAFTKQMGTINAKEDDFLEVNIGIKKLRKLDLHGFSLSEANQEVEKFITESYKKDCKKLLIVTGKGLRSKSYDNPYLSEKLSVLRNSVPDFIVNNQNIMSKVVKISKAELKDGGEGAFYVYLKNNKKL